MQPHARRPVDGPAAVPAALRRAGILAVVALAGLLAGALLPACLRGSPAAGERVRAAAAELVSVLETARFRAVSLGRPVSVAFEPAGSEDFYTAWVPSDGRPAPVADPASAGPGDSVAATGIPFPDEAAGLRGRELPAGVEFGSGDAGSPADGYGRGPEAAIELPTNPVVFRPSGGVRWPTGLLAPAGGVYLRDGDDARAVSVVLIHPTGLIRSYRWSDGGWR